MHSQYFEQNPNYDVNQGPYLCCKFTKNDALQSGPDRIRTLAFMATDSSHWKGDN